MSLHSRLYGGRCTPTLLRVHGNLEPFVYVSPDGTRIPVRGIAGAIKGLQESDGMGGREFELELDMLIVTADLANNGQRELNSDAKVVAKGYEWVVDVQRSAVGEHWWNTKLVCVPLMEESTQRGGPDGSV